MSNAQKLLFAGTVVFAVVIGNHLGSANRAGGVLANGTSVASVNDASFLEPVAEVQTPESATADFARSASSSIGEAATGTPEASSAPVHAPVNSAASDGVLRSSAASPSQIFYRTGDEAPPAILARAAIVADLETGEAYFELNPDTRWPLASITKLMTAVMAVQHMDQNGALTFTPGDFDGSAEADFLKAGDKYSFSDVLRIMLLLSKNEAAQALAGAYGKDKFVGGLNGLANDWGLGDTHFADPTGLSIANQSTILDIKKFALLIYRDYPNIFEITRRKRATITELNANRKLVISNINLFAGRSDFLGGKTGYTDDAGGNLVSIFSYGRRPILVVVLGTGDRFGETESLFNWFVRNFKRSR